MISDGEARKLRVRGGETEGEERGGWVGALEGLTSVPPFFFIYFLFFFISLPLSDVFVFVIHKIHTLVSGILFYIALIMMLTVTLKLHKGSKDVEYI